MKYKMYELVVPANFTAPVLTILTGSLPHIEEKSNHYNGNFQTKCLLTEIDNCPKVLQEFVSNKLKQFITTMDKYWITNCPYVLVCHRDLPNGKKEVGVFLSKFPGERRIHWLD